MKCGQLRAEPSGCLDWNSKFCFCCCCNLCSCSLCDGVVAVIVGAVVAVEDFRIDGGCGGRRGSVVAGAAGAADVAVTSVAGTGAAGAGIDVVASDVAAVAVAVAWR